MATGESSGRAAASGSRSFDFGFDDILCSYDDFSAQDTSVGKRSDPPGKDLHENSMGRPLVSIYEQEDYSREGVLPSVEKCMKKYADNLLRSLDGICGRLSQLEIVCYKLERSVGELRADFTHDQSEKEVKFKFLEKHLQEVHRSVQVLRDKQELVETQRELVKLQLGQKAPEKNENTNLREASEPKSQNEKPDTGNQQLVLALPRQTDQTVLPTGTSQQVQPYKELSIPQQALVPPNIQQGRVMLNQFGNYYGQHQRVLQDQRNQPVPPEPQYIQPGSQLQDRPHQAQPQLPLSVNQNQPPSSPQYLQQLPPQPDQHMQQQTASQAQIRSPPPPSYNLYSSQPVNSGPETFPSSMPMQVPNPAIARPGGIRPETFPYGYGKSGSTVSQPPLPLHHGIQRPMQPPVSQSSFAPQLGKGSSFMGIPPYPPPSLNMQGYNAAYGYPPSNLPADRNQQVPPPTHQYDSQSIRNHPNGEMIEKVINMGFDENQVINVVQRMSDRGQPVDFNSLLDRLSGQTVGISARPR